MTAKKSDSLTLTSIQAASLKEWVDKMNHLIVGNGEVGVLERVRLIQTTIDSHEKALAMLPGIVTKLDRVTEYVDAVQTERAVEAIKNQDRWRTVRRGIWEVVRLGAPAALTSGGAVWAYLHGFLR